MPSTLNTSFEPDLTDVMSAALRQPDGNEDPTFKKLKEDLVAALTPFLPPR